MTPPLGVDRARRGSDHVSSGESSLPSFLAVANLFRDPANTSDPDHFSREWSGNQDFRTQHGELYLALDALRTFFRGTGGELTGSQREALTAFRRVAEATSGSVEAVVLGNLRQGLDSGSSEHQERYRRVMEVIGGVVISAGGIAAPASGFRVSSLTLDTHFADAAMRTWPSYYSLGVLPREGLNQSQNSALGLSAGAEFQIGEFTAFANVYFGHDIVADANPAAHFERLALRFGLVEYPRPLYGRRDNFHIGILIGGRSRAGFGVGVGWCDRIDDAAVSGARCPDPTFQLLSIGESDFLDIGYGPISFAVRPLASTAFINIGPSGLVSLNRVPLEFGLTWHLTPPLARENSSDPESVFRRSVSTPEIAFTGVNLLGNAISANFRREQEAAYERTRIISLGMGSSGANQIGLLNLGSFFNGVLGGLAEGSMAYRLHSQLRHGNPLQQGLLGAMLGVEFAVFGIGALAMPADPGRDGSPGSIQGQAFQLAWPTLLTRDALSVLGAFGVFGDRNEAIRSGAILGHFQAAHLLLTLGGLALTLTSGDGSGSGFFGLSILGNTPPNTGMIRIEGSSYDYPNQRLQYYRLETGMMLLSYGLSGLLDWGFGRLSYLSMLNECREHPERCSSSPATASRPPISVSVNTDGQTHVMGTVSGTF